MFEQFARCRMDSKVIGIAAAGLLCGASNLAYAQDWRVASPSGTIALEVRQTSDGGLQYRIERASRPVVDWSTLGIELKKTDADLKILRHDFTRGLSIASVEREAFHDRFMLSVGKRLENQTSANEMRLRFKGGARASFGLDIRAFDDGVAFRYTIGATGTPDDAIYHQVEREATTFNLAPAITFYGQPYDKADGWRPSYEAPAISQGVAAGASVPREMGAGWAFPMLFHTSKDWVLIHESGLYGQYHGTHIAPQVTDKVYTLVGPLPGEALGVGESVASITLPWASPWRTFVVGDLSTIVESNLVQALAEPSRIGDASWIKPGISSWSWPSDHDSSQHADALKNFIDLSAEMGWPYSLVDANWNRMGDAAIEDLVAYARERNVGLIFWYNSGGPNNAVAEAPRNIMNDAALRDAEFAKLERLGVKGVKVDFWQSDKQFMMKQYVALLEDAARHHLLVNLHGSTIPRGWERTYPNLVTMEAVRGDEFYTFASTPDYGALAPAQNAFLPFARNAIGSMDATPIMFAPKTVSRRTTNAHEAALGVVFESGVQHLPDTVEAYRSLPSAWKDYLRRLPTAWTETRLLAGDPGRYAVIARRKNGRWWIAGINGEAAPRDITLDLSFVTGESTMLADDGRGGFANRPAETRERQSVITMRPYGGFVIFPK